LDFAEFRKTRLGFVSEYIEKNGVPQKPGLVELLEYLKERQYKIVVATSTDAVRANFYFEKAGLGHYFDSIICGDSVAARKPAPDIYLKACEMIFTAPGECLALEDSPIGILAAHRAGMKPVMIPDLLLPDEETKKLLFAQLSSLVDVIDLLDRSRLDG
jgi:HAD superfamily hydrolase (TIGR01509 family)